jgi:phospholipase C
LYDHTSVLKMIEWRWNLRPLTVRDQTANNLAEVLDFANRNLTAPAFTVPAGPFGTICPLAGAGDLEALADLALLFGFELPI